jgi:FkbM family methyltransferase
MKDNRSYSSFFENECPNNKQIWFDHINISQLRRAIIRLLNTRSKIMIARFFYRLISFTLRLQRKDERMLVTRNGLHWHLDLSEGIDLSIFLLGAFERQIEQTAADLLENIQKAVILDIGANVGSQTLPLARIASKQGGLVYAFEPTEWACRKLMRNLEANPELATFVQLHQCFVTRPDITEIPNASSASWSLSDQMEGRNNFLGIEKSTLGAGPVTIDGFLREHEIDVVHFIKLDVDGYEADVLMGAMDCLRVSHPAIMMEWAPHLDPDGRLRKQVDLLLNEGYQLTIPGKRSAFASLDALSTRIPPNGGIQVLLVPTGEGQ